MEETDNRSNMNLELAEKQSNMGSISNVPQQTNQSNINMTQLRRNQSTNSTYLILDDQQSISVVPDLNDWNDINQQGVTLSRQSSYQSSYEMPSYFRSLGGMESRQGRLNGGLFDNKDNKMNEIYHQFFKQN